MFAAQYEGDGRIAVAEVGNSAPGRGEVTIAVAFTGICGTDLHILHGAMDARVTLPAVIGHEMSGRILAIGEGVDGWSVGDAVGVMPLDWCGDCPACRAGHHHICHNLNFIGIDSAGALQNEWTVPASVLVRLPEGLDLRSAALLEPVAVATHDLRRGRVSSGDTVLVVGGGPIGALIAHGAARLGADVVVSEPDASRRDLLAEFGVATIDPLTEDLAARVSDWSDGAGATVAFEVSGTQPGVDAAVANLATRGRFVLVAIHPQPRPVDLFRIFWRELEIVGARVYEREDFEAAAALLAAESAALSRLITEVFPLSRTADAFARLGAGGGVMKVLVDCTPDGV